VVVVVVVDDGTDVDAVADDGDDVDAADEDGDIAGALTRRAVRCDEGFVGGD
jgi:hypothetical protein